MDVFVLPDNVCYLSFVQKKKKVYTILSKKAFEVYISMITVRIQGLTYYFPINIIKIKKMIWPNSNARKEDIENPSLVELNGQK